ncbi:MAG: TRAP transporter small permease subunit [Proteobacteria bacterium]|nr:TRAP transporter small permease subunit [Pseudomonadota bacterium]
MLGTLERLTLKAAQAMAVAGLTLLILYAALTLTNGLLRGLADSPLYFVDDLSRLVVADAVACCFPLAYLQRINITVKFIGTFCGQRAGRVLDALAALAVALVAGLMAWQVLVFAGQDAAAGDTTLMLGIETGPLWYVAAGALTAAALVQGLVVVLETARCFGYEWHHAVLSRNEPGAAKTVDVQ